MCAKNTGTELYAETYHEISQLYIFVGGQAEDPLKMYSVKNVFCYWSSLKTYAENVASCLRMDLL